MNGSLPCDKGCPSGYVCATGNRCWRPDSLDGGAGGAGTGADSSAPDAPGPGTGGAAALSTGASVGGAAGTTAPVASTGGTVSLASDAGAGGIRGTGGAAAAADSAAGGSPADSSPPPSAGGADASSADAAAVDTARAPLVCPGGYDDCDGDPSNGCETDLSIPAHCGGCGNACNATHASVACQAGRCVVLSCVANYGDCGGVNDGCETNLLDDANHCGKCDRTCSRSHDTPVCSGGQCTIGSCEAGYGDCDKDAGNGCEINTQISVANCGKCGNACGSAHATASCAAGACILACDTGYKDCDGQNANGCEADTRSDPANCGVCGKACAGDCVAGICQPAVLASNQNSLVGIALDSDYVYWINSGGGAADGTVARVKKTGKPANVEVLSSAEQRPSSLAVNLNGVYWVNRGTEGGTDGAVRGLLKAGGGAFDVATGQQMPCSIAVTLASAYWVTSRAGTVGSKIWTSALSASSSPQLVSTSSSSEVYQRVVLDSSNLYFGDTYAGYKYEVYKIPLSNLSSQPSVVDYYSATSGSEIRVAVYAGTVMYSVAVGELSVVGKAIKANVAGPMGVAIDAKGVFWAQSGAIMRSPNPPTSGFDTATQLVAATAPTEIAIDDNNVYYLEPSLGQVMAAPR